MCHAVTCKTCGKPTWAGCGRHVESVKRRVPDSQWCDGHASTQTGSIFTRLTGRKK